MGHNFVDTIQSRQETYNLVNYKNMDNMEINTNKSNIQKV